MDVSFIGDSFRLLRGKGFIKRCFGVGIQIIHHEANFLSMGIMLINQCVDKVRPVNFCPLISDFGIALTSEGCKGHKNVRGPISLLLGIIPEGLARLGGQRSANCTNELGGHFIHAYLRILRIIGLFIEV